LFKDIVIPHNMVLNLPMINVIKISFVQSVF